MRLVREQEIAHFPELALLAGTLCGFGRAERVRVWLLEWEMAKHESHLLPVVLEQHLHRGRSVFAVRALEVAVLHNDHGGVLGAERVVRSLDRYREVETVLIHLSSS